MQYAFQVREKTENKTEWHDNRNFHKEATTKSIAHVKSLVVEEKKQFY